jgi:hypothetical protein
MRPFVKGETGVVRFQANEIVRVLLDESTERGFSLNNLARRDFSQADWEEFYQLIGYSLAGYHELSRVSDKSALDASKRARAQLSAIVGGCRDTGCEIHCGVEKNT